MELYESIIKARRQIKKKFNDFKQGKISEGELFEKQLKPVSDPLKELLKLNHTVSKPKQTDFSVLKQPKQLEAQDVSDEDIAAEKDQFFEAPPASPIMADLALSRRHKTPPDIRFWTSLEDKYGSEVGEYLYNLLLHPSQFDQVYGVRVDSNGKNWFIGSQPIEFIKKGSILKVGNSKFTYSPGLLELLFKKNPVQYTENELASYKKILDLTHEGPIKVSKRKKYSRVIKHLYAKEGGGIFVPVSSHRTFVHWKDPNQLVKRLSLLHSSQAAGNTGVSSEILSILRELKASHYIL